ncbi:MAG: class I SAM-dependent methyltransferase [Acidobacteriota bacterium]
MTGEERFEFGGNWARFLSALDEKRIEAARDSLARSLGEVPWRQGSFLDIGSGSGLFSLCARQLGARVVSFDLDPRCVACTLELRRRYFSNDAEWAVRKGSVLDADFLESLGQHDVVYAWGSLHHTGGLWQAMQNVVPLVRPGGRLLVAIYNDQGWRSRVWAGVKRTYVRLPPALRFLVLVPAFARLWGPTLVRDLARLRPLRSWRSYGSDRGMTPWRNVVDWVGGYPFEVAKPESVFDFYRRYGFELRRLSTCGGGHGCNEFVFVRSSA